MLLILVLVSTALSSPIEWDAKDPKLRSLLESGGPADTTGSWTPDYTPEVKVTISIQKEPFDLQTKSFFFFRLH